MNSKKVLLSLFAGLAAGATLGILFSPDKGSSIRNKISKKGDDLLDSLEDRITELAKMFMQKFESHSSKEYLNAIKSDINKVKSDSVDAFKS